MMERGFHDAILRQVQRRGTDLHLTIENVAVYDAGRELGLENGQLVIGGVVSIAEDGVIVFAPTASFADGSILDLQISPTGVVLLVEWCTYQPATSVTMEYVIKAGRVDWQPSGPLFQRSDL